MAFVTIQPGVAPQQCIASLTVVKFLLRGFPFVDPHCWAVVLRMTPNAIRVSLLGDAPVVTLPLAHQPPNLCMTRQTLEFDGCRAKDMAGSAVERTVQRLMCLGHRSW
jgi:hypothetical protein